jgi:diguanylate cyclase (GGDEF)-like protein
VAVRAEERNQRCRHLLHRGPGGYPLDSSRALVHSVEKHLMPATLAGQEVLFWAELPSTLPWSRTFNQAGLTCVAAAPLRGHADTPGIIWIARRGGERLERHHIHMLEAMAPVIASRLEFAQLRESMRHLELTDPVTDLANRAQFDRRALKLQNRPGYPWSVVALKLDRFHRFNDTGGHAFADRVLRDAALAIRDAVRRSCFVARFDGATFGVLCPETPVAEAGFVAERLRRAIGALRVTLPGGSTDQLTASIGVATSPGDGNSALGVIGAAFARAEMAKHSGRDCCVSQGDLPQRQAG